MIFLEKKRKWFAPLKRFKTSNLPTDAFTNCSLCSACHQIIWQFENEFIISRRFSDKKKCRQLQRPVLFFRKTLFLASNRSTLPLWSTRFSVEFFFAQRWNRDVYRIFQNQNLFKHKASLGTFFDETKKLAEWYSFCTYQKFSKTQIFLDNTIFLKTKKNNFWDDLLHISRNIEKSFSKNECQVVMLSCSISQQFYGKRQNNWPRNCDSPLWFIQIFLSGPDHTNLELCSAD